MTLTINPITTNTYYPTFKSARPQKDPFDEQLERRYILTGFLRGHNEITGSVNDCDVSLVEEEIVKDNEIIKSYKGNIGKREAEINIQGKKITGSIGKKEIELIFNKSNFGEFYISGAIGEDFINFGNASTLEDTEPERDVVITVLSLMGHKVSLNSTGRIMAIGLSKQAKLDKSRQQLSDWQIAQQNQMLMQSIAIKNQIFENSEIFKDIDPNSDGTEDTEAQGEEEPKEGIVQETKDDNTGDGEIPLYNELLRI